LRVAGNLLLKVLPESDVVVARDHMAAKLDHVRGPPERKAHMLEKVKRLPQEEIDWWEHRHADAMKA
jgi:hypothetical protein